MTGCGRPGFPIQKSPDHWMFGSYPRLIAAYRVFLRLPMPRHPPDALFILVILLPDVLPHDYSQEKTTSSFPTLFNCQGASPVSGCAKQSLDDADETYSSARSNSVQAIICIRSMSHSFCGKDRSLYPAFPGFCWGLPLQPA